MFQCYSFFVFRCFWGEEMFVQVRGLQSWAPACLTVPMAWQMLMEPSVAHGQPEQMPSWAQAMSVEPPTDLWMQEKVLWLKAAEFWFVRQHCWQNSWLYPAWQRQTCLLSTLLWELMENMYVKCSEQYFGLLLLLLLLLLISHWTWLTEPKL